MSVRSLTQNFAVTGQIKPTDVADIASSGFKAIVCMRPDNEGFFQPSFDTVRQAADAAGLKAYYLPVKPGSFSPEQAVELNAIIKATEGPILAYCASGNRCAMAYEWANRV